MKQLLKYVINCVIFMQWHCTLYGTPISIYFSNNYFTIVNMQNYFGVLCVCMRACVCIYTYLAGNESPGSAQKLYKHLNSHGSYGFLLKCIGLMK